MLAGCTHLLVTAVPSTLRINTPSAWSKPQHDAVHRQGRTPTFGSPHRLLWPAPGRQSASYDVCRVLEGRPTLDGDRPVRGAMGEAVAALSKVSTHFRVAFAYRMPFIATHLTVRLVTSALFVPFIGLLLGAVVGFSGRSATTDQDIARLLLTPAGAFALLAAITLGIG